MIHPMQLQFYKISFKLDCANPIPALVNTFNVRHFMVHFVFGIHDLIKNRLTV